MSLIDDYTKKGWALVRLKPRDKMPIGSGWQKAGHPPAAFRPEDNVGVLLGQASGNLLDLDLDSAEAQVIADWLAPASWWRFGHSNTVGHLLLRAHHVPDDFTRKPFLDQREPLVDVRGSRHQTMLPPSTHPNGQPVQWHQTGQWLAQPPNGPVPSVHFDHVMQFVENVVQLTRIARRWTAGSRHDAALALAGWLAHSGVTRDFASGAFTAVLHAAGDDEVPDRMAAFDTTWARAESGGNVQGIATLKQLLSPDGPLLHVPTYYTKLTSVPDPSRLPGAPRAGVKGQPAASPPPKHDVSPQEQQPSAPAPAETDDDTPATIKIAQRYTRESDDHLLFFHDEFWLRSKGQPHFRVADRARLRSNIRRSAAPNASPTTLGHVLSVLEDTCTPGQAVLWDFDFPFSLSKGVPHPEQIIAFRNGTVSLDDPLTLRPHDPDLALSSSLPFDLPTDDPQCPTWFDVMRDWFGDDEESETLLRQWFGYVLSGDRSLERVGAFVGPPNSGKSTASRVLRNLVGEDNVISSSLAALSRPFGLASWQNKTLAILPESQPLTRADEVAISATRVLAVSGQDPIEVERKNQRSITVELPARIMMVGNKTPSVGDDTGAFSRRLLPIPFPRIHTKHRPGLEQALVDELPGIAYWSLIGLMELRAAGGFTETETSTETRAFELAVSSPLRAWADEHLEFDPLFATRTDELRLSYNQWVVDQGGEELSQRVFSKTFRDTFSLFGKRRAQGYTWFGVRLADQSFD